MSNQKYLWFFKEKMNIKKMAFIFFYIFLISYRLNSNWCYFEDIFLNVYT